MEAFSSSLQPSWLFFLHVVVLACGFRKSLSGGRIWNVVVLVLIQLQTSFLCSIPNCQLIDCSLLTSSFSRPDTPAILGRLCIITESSENSVCISDSESVFESRVHCIETLPCKLQNVLVVKLEKLGESPTTWGCNAPPLGPQPNVQYLALIHQC